jgi:hypothetical protein
MRLDRNHRERAIVMAANARFGSRTGISRRAPHVWTDAGTSRVTCESVKGYMRERFAPVLFVHRQSAQG